MLENYKVIYNKIDYTLVHFDYTKNRLIETHSDFIFVVRKGG
jgi:hypothetical protein